MHVTGRWPIALPAAESVEGLGAGAPDAAVLDAPPAADGDGSLSEHEASFSPEARSAPADDDAAAATRDDKGQFKPRHRAASQRADVDDLPAINEHTRRVKEAEAKLGADIVKKPGESERVFTLRRRAELLERQSTAQPQATASAPTPIAAPQPVQRPVSEPAAAPAPAAEKPERFTYPTYPQASAQDPNLDYDQWELDRFNAYRDWDRAQTTAAAEKATADARQAEIKQEFDAALTSWHARRQDFLTKHPDRAADVQAFVSRLNAGTPIGDTLLFSEVGIELADHLAANMAEAERIARLNPIQQFLALGKIEASLVASQRPSPSTRTAAAPTGSAPASLRPSVPRPPNPVRTGSIAEPDTPPDADDQSLSAHEKFYGRKYR